MFQQNTSTFFAHVEAETGAGLPKFVKDEFEAYLECGILAHGFLRLRVVFRIWTHPKVQQEIDRCIGSKEQACSRISGLFNELCMALANMESACARVPNVRAASKLPGKRATFLGAGMILGAMMGDLVSEQSCGG